MKAKDKEKINMYIENYEGLKRNRDIIKSIDRDYFFEMVDCLIEGYKEYEEENKRMKMSKVLRFTPSIKGGREYESDR